MNLLLKDFQVDAVEQLYSQTADARKRAAKNKLEVCTLSAPTGSGKTVILTRLIELILQGDDCHNPDPECTFLWLTDLPELNTQTRDKMRVISDVLLRGTTVEIGHDFDQECFSSGTVYFLNTQKLGANSSWIRKSDERTFTLWDTIRNTTTTKPGKFFAIIDEAHRGTRLDRQKAAEANSIMQKFVLGGEEIPAIPLLVGISATLERFTELLEEAAKSKKARTHQRVDVDPSDVIESGLLKRKIVIEHPQESLAADFPLLRAGVRVWNNMEQRWADYCAKQEEQKVVRPILLIQVEDGTKGKTSKTDLDAVVKAVISEAGALKPMAFAHAFQEGTPIALQSGTTIRYLAPSDIDADSDVKIVLFKTSLSTGWDCPRAEVMVSFRGAKDATFIAQLVGRMVRAPLAREIEQDQVLNSVSLVLPNFDQDELKNVIQRLTDRAGDVPPTTVEDSRNRFILERATTLAKCFDVIQGLPTYIIPRRRVLGDIQRLGALADSLMNSGLRSNAGSEAREGLVNVLEEEYSNRKDQSSYKEVIKEDGEVSVNTVVLDYATAHYESEETRRVPVSDEMVSEIYEWSRKRLGLDLGLRYWKRRAAKDESQNYTITKLELYALASDIEVLDRLKIESANLVSNWLSKYKHKIAKLPESEKSQFEEIKHQVSKPTLDFIDFENRLTLDWSAPEDAPRWKDHLYQTAEGTVPEKLNTWETKVLTHEMSNESFVGWLRNRDRQPWSLCIPYESSGVWRGCYPDFLVFRSREDGTTAIDIIDPHLVSLEDSPTKAVALAKYADEHQDRFGRIDLIIVDKQSGEERIKRLRLIDDDTRKKVLGVTTTQHLRDLFDWKA